MKVSELTRRAAVPLPTIKYYIREGLLPPGERTAKNQADYTEEHLERLTLIRALKDDAGLSIATIAKMLRASDTAKNNFIGSAIDAIERPVGPELDESSPAFVSARDALLELGADMGWDCSDWGGALRDATRALVTIQRAFPVNIVPLLKLYAQIAQQFATLEIPDDWSPLQPRMATLRYAVLGTLLFEPLILGLRRMAHAARATALERRAVAAQSRGEPRAKAPARAAKKRGR
jgi:DNA-binding transcriptional MerR regulator